MPSLGDSYRCEVRNNLGSDSEYYSIKVFTQHYHRLASFLFSKIIGFFNGYTTTCSCSSGYPPYRGNSRSPIGQSENKKLQMVVREMCTRVMASLCGNLEIRRSNHH